MVQNYLIYRYMKKQILFIGWGEALENYNNKKFVQNKLNFYKNDYDFNPFLDKINNWKDYLSEELKDTHDFVKMHRPMSDSAIYDFWKVSFEQTLKFLDDKPILIWHSLWAIFLIKYFCDKPKYIKNIKQIFLISTPLNDSYKEVLWSFCFDIENLKNIKEYEDKFAFIHSVDDDIVSENDFYEYQKQLKNSSFYSFDNYWHFIFNEKFPELLELIKNVKYE